MFFNIEGIMPSWLIFTLIATVCAGIFPIFYNKAVQTNGVIMNLVSTNMVFTTFSVMWLITHPGDLSILTKKSLLFVGTGALFNLIGGLCMFSAFKLNPGGLSIIMITISFSMAILAIINHFLGSKMLPHQWVGTIIALFGIALIHWKR